MSNKSYFALCYWIPSDEKIVARQVFKLVKLGNNPYKYIWIDVAGTTTNGIGTAIKLEEIGSDSPEKAFLQFIKICGTNYDKFSIDEYTFEEMLDKCKDFENFIKQKLNEIS